MHSIRTALLTSLFNVRPQQTSLTPSTGHLEREGLRVDSVTILNVS